jgi:hypothetical protein
MRQLDELVDAWMDAVGDAEPLLRPHLEEIADHVRTDARARVASGSEVPAAFAAAVGAIGAPHDIAHDYAITEDREERRLAGRFAVATILGTLAVTAIVVAIDKRVQPIDPRWFAFTYLPLLIAWTVAFFARFQRRARLRRRAAGAR